jgi:hypothetical protein
MRTGDRTAVVCRTSWRHVGGRVRQLVRAAVCRGLSAKPRSLMLGCDEPPAQSREVAVAGEHIGISGDAAHLDLSADQRTRGVGVRFREARVPRTPDTASRVPRVAHVHADHPAAATARDVEPDRRTAGVGEVARVDVVGEHRRVACRLDWSLRPSSRWVLAFPASGSGMKVGRTRPSATSSRAGWSRDVMNRGQQVAAPGLDSAGDALRVEREHLADQRPRPHGQDGRSRVCCRW